MKSGYKVTYEKENGETTEETFMSRNTAKKFKVDMENRHKNVRIYEKSVTTDEWSELK